MADIAFDAGSEGSADGVASLTFSLTVSGANRILFVGIFTSGADPEVDRVTGVTYNGVAMTRIDARGSGNIFAYLYFLIAPATGTNDVVISVSPNGNIRGVAASYTGAKQSGVPDASATEAVSGVATITDSVTTVADNCWTVSTTSNNVGEPTADTGVTARHTGSPYGFGDSNGAVTPAGSYSMTWDYPGSGLAAMVMASFAPVVDAPTTGLDLTSKFW